MRTLTRFSYVQTPTGKKHSAKIGARKLQTTTVPVCTALRSKFVFDRRNCLQAATGVRGRIVRPSTGTFVAQRYSYGICCLLLRAMRPSLQNCHIPVPGTYPAYSSPTCVDYSHSTTGKGWRMLYSCGVSSSPPKCVSRAIPMLVFCESRASMGTRLRNVAHYTQPSSPPTAFHMMHSRCPKGLHTPLYMLSRSSTHRSTDRFGAPITTSYSGIRYDTARATRARANEGPEAEECGSVPFLILQAVPHLTKCVPASPLDFMRQMSIASIIS